MVNPGKNGGIPLEPASESIAGDELRSPSAQWQTEGTEHHCVVFNEHGFPWSQGPKAPSSKRPSEASLVKEIIEVLSSSIDITCIYMYLYIPYRSGTIVLIVFPQRPFLVY